MGHLKHVGKASLGTLSEICARSGPSYHPQEACSPPQVQPRRKPGPTKQQFFLTDLRAGTTSNPWSNLWSRFFGTRLLSLTRSVSYNDVSHGKQETQVPCASCLPPGFSCLKDGRSELARLGSWQGTQPSTVQPSWKHEVSAPVDNRRRVRRRQNARE